VGAVRVSSEGACPPLEGILLWRTIPGSPTNQKSSGVKDGCSPGFPVFVLSKARSSRRNPLYCKSNMRAYNSPPPDKN